MSKFSRAETKISESPNSKRYPKADILILNFNGKHHLKICLDSLLRTDYPNFNIILVDNGSEDDSLEFVRTDYPMVTVIENKKNLGFSRGYNGALLQTQASILVFLNNDVEVDKNWLKELICYLEEPRVAATTSKLLSFFEREKINACGGIMDKYGCSFNRGIGQLDVGQYDRVEEVFYAVGAAMAVRQSVLEEVGFFDEDYFAYWEDVDWCWRARLLGYRIIYVPSSVVYHKWRGTSERATNSKHIYNLERNRLATLLKNYSAKTLFLVIPQLALLETLKILWILVNWLPTDSVAVVKAFLWNLTHLSTTIRKRHMIQRGRKLSDRDILKKIVSRSIELQAVVNSNSFLAKHPLLSSGA